MTCLKKLNKHRDKIIKYVVVIVNLLYIIGLAITSMVLNGEKLDKNMASTFTAPIISLIIAFVRTETTDLYELTKTFKKISEDSVITQEDIEKCGGEIINVINSARSVAQSVHTIEPTDDDITIMNAYYSRSTQQFIKLTPRIPTLPV